MAQEIAQFYATIGANTKDLTKGLFEAKEGMSALGKTTDALAMAFKAAFVVGVAAAAGFTAIIAKSVNAAADMEQSVADIGATMTLTDADTQKLGDHIMDLGLDPHLKVSATEAAGAVESLGQAGLSMSQIMGGASKATVLLANATGLNGQSGFAAAANIATDIMGQFNISAGEMNEAVNQVAGTTIASKFNVDDYRLAIAQAGGVAGALGVTFEDFNAVIAATSTSFAGGSDSGTSYKTFLTTLIPVSQKAEGAMMDLGLITADGANQFFDASGKMKDMAGVAGVLQTAFSGLSDAQRNDAAATIFGRDAMRTALALAEGGPAIINAMKGSIGKVDAEELAAKRMDTFRGAMEIAQGIIEAITISIGQKFLPILRPLIETFSVLAQEYGPKVVDFFAQLADALTPAANWMVKFVKGTDGARDVLTHLWEQTMKVVEAIQVLIKPVMDAAKRFFDWQDVLNTIAVLIGATLLPMIWGLISALAPIIATFAAITVAVAALRHAWETDFMGIRTATNNTLKAITDWFYKDSGIWKGTWEKTLDYLAWWADSGWKIYVFWPIRGWLIQTQFEIYAWSLRTQGKIEAWIHDTAHNLEHGLSVIESFFVETWGHAVSLVEHWADGAWDAIDFWARRTDTVFMVWKNNTMGMFREWMGKVIDFFQPVLDWWDDHVQPWINAGRDVIQGLWDGIKDKWYDMTNWFTGVWEDLKRKFKNFFGISSPSRLFEGYGENISLGLAKGISGAQGSVDAAMSGLSMGVTGATTYADYGASSSAPTTSTARIEELLTILIQELRAKNMTANVNVSGGGMGLGDLVGMKAGLA